ncbi:MAG: DUF5689 domain-containing protein [Bacteroidales bacterium]|jgi:hypothetical protein|nr:DUF5689 domain-containing protein [Bacteroidales bacterium]
MKRNKILLLSAFITAIVFFVACDKELDTPPIKAVDPDKVLEIKDLYQIQADSGDSYVFTDDYMLYATVVMDDATGNIYKEAYLQDTTGGINLYKLSSAEATKEGDYIRINLNGVEIKNYSGKMELIFSNILDFGKSMVVQQTNVPIEPAVVTVEDLLTGEYDCELVTITGVQFVDADTVNTYATIGGTSSQNRTLEDCNGNEVIVRNSDYADFAGDTLPSGMGSITGIATKYQYTGGDIVWQLIVRTPDEVLLNGPRCGLK